MPAFWCEAVDPKWGDVTWSDAIHADTVQEAEVEARAEYNVYVRGAYEAGHYKAAVVAEAPVEFRIKRA